MNKEATLKRERLLVNMPADLKKEAAARATTNFNDEVVGVLCRRLGVKFEPSGYRRTADVAGPSPKTLLRVPEALKLKIQRRAVTNRTNQTIEVCRELADEYGMEYAPTSGTRAPVGGGRRRAAPAGRV